MTISIGTRPLQLTLLPNDVLPEGLSWKIQEGYIRTVAWDQEGDSITLGLWGPGEWVTTAYSALRPIEIQCLTTVVVEQTKPTADQVSQFLADHIRTVEEIFRINRIKSAEERLLQLLTWIGSRLALGDICGLTRVTVTKNLSLIRTKGTLQQISNDDLFIPNKLILAT
ncbi:MAG: Crp/Fnr family transcriptional regulator [Synechococcaceae bacterium WB6_3B_236]|nr:Crp/Fnr family transcriptional regulator [Synechococcaceae bacterium WB6_3B_236]